MLEFDKKVVPSSSFHFLRSFEIFCRDQFSEILVIFENAPQIPNKFLPKNSQTNFEKLCPFVCFEPLGVSGVFSRGKLRCWFQKNRPQVHIFNIREVRAVFVQKFWDFWSILTKIPHFW